MEKSKSLEINPYRSKIKSPGENRGFFIQHFYRKNLTLKNLGFA